MRPTLSKSILLGICASVTTALPQGSQDSVPAPAPGAAPAPGPEPIQSDINVTLSFVPDYPPVPSNNTLYHWVYDCTPAMDKLCQSDAAAGKWAYQTAKSCTVGIYLPQSAQPPTKATCFNTVNQMENIATFNGAAGQTKANTVGFNGPQIQLAIQGLHPGSFPVPNQYVYNGSTSAGNTDLSRSNAVSVNMNSQSGKGYPGASLVSPPVAIDQSQPSYLFEFLG